MSILRKPKKLQKGDTIAIVSIAGKIDLEKVQLSIKTFESWGLKVVLGKTIGTEYFQYAGTDNERLKDFQNMLNNKNIKAIICARGGYGTIRILNKIDFTQFMSSPKWIVGYSDITVLHTHINTYLAVQTIHSTMPVNFKSNTKESLQTLKNSLFGLDVSYSFASNKYNKFAKVKGEIIGGNLSILYSLLGTNTAFNTDNKILFIEEVGEKLYHIDRMMIALKKAGKLNKLKALIVGGMTHIKDNTKEFGYLQDDPFGKNIEEIILEHCSDYDFPICFDFPAGHQNNNNAIVLGKKIHLSIAKNNCSFKINF